MFQVNLSLAATFLTSLFFSANGSPSLQLVHLVFRHGERTPADTYPLDPHINNTFEPYGWGQLTNRGKLDLYESGQWLKRRYEDFFEGRYPGTKGVEVITTDVDRTKMSAALVLAGLFPPVGDQVWNPNLLWQPIPSSHQAYSQDKLLLVNNCPRYFEAKGSVVKEPEVQKVLSQYQETYTYVQNNTGLIISNPDDIQSVFSTLKAEKDFGLKLPPWTESVYPEDLSEITTFSYVLNAYNDELKKLKGGPLLKKIVGDSLNKMDGGNDKIKMYMYAGHDSTVTNLMLAANVWERQMPTYGIMGLFEIYQENHNYLIRIFLRNSTQEEPFFMEIPGCPEPCLLVKFAELVKPVLPQDINAECVTKDPSYTTPKTNGP